MRTSRPRPRRCVPAGGGLFTRRLWLWIVLLLLIPWIGCTAERRYRVLSFFFDGVPDPNAPQGVAEFDTEGRPVVRAVSFAHKPYEEGNCAVCHANATGSYEDFSKLEDSICLKCHQQVPDAYPRMHGPVALGQCSLCHVPHESSVRPLLKESAPGVCVACHVQELLPPSPADHLTDRNCMDCHSGHGGTARGLLHAGWKSQVPSGERVPPEAPPPSTGPVTAPAEVGR